MVRLIARRLRQRRGVQFLNALLFIGTVGLATIFGLHTVAISTSAHSRVTETAQAAAYAAASAAQPGQGAGVITIPDLEARALAAAVKEANMNGDFGLRAADVQVEVTPHNLAFDVAQNRALTDVNPVTKECSASAAVPPNTEVFWTDSLGECHFATGVTVTVTTRIRPCLLEGFVKKLCPEVTIKGVGYADYTYQSSNRRIS